MRPQPSTSRLQPLQCMEVWGGNAEIDNGVSLAGLDCWVYSRPFLGDSSAGTRREGGDIHYVTSCATGRITRLVVADVSGHGAPVAEMAVSLRRLMRKHSNHYDQRLFVESVNQRFGVITSGRDLRDGDSGEDRSAHDDRDDGEGAGNGGGDSASTFATAVFGSYYAPTDEFSLCNAGHPHPLRFDSRRAVWEPLELKSPSDDARPPSPGAPRTLANLPLGIIGEARYDQCLFKLGRDDLVLIYTDSLVEVRTPGEGRSRMLGEKGLIEICSRLDPSRPDAFIADLLEALRAASCKPDFEFDDDVTVLLLRRNDLKPRISPLNSLKGAKNLVIGALGALKPGGLPVSIPDLGVKAILGSAFSIFNKPFNKA